MSAAVAAARLPTNVRTQARCQVDGERLSGRMLLGKSSAATPLLIMPLGCSGHTSCMPEWVRQALARRWWERFLAPSHRARRAADRLLSTVSQEPLCVNLFAGTLVKPVL